jgi:hypothetical protein
MAAGVGLDDNGGGLFPLKEGRKKGRKEGLGRKV